MKNNYIQRFFAYTSDWKPLYKIFGHEVTHFLRYLFYFRLVPKNKRVSIFFITT